MGHSIIDIIERRDANHLSMDNPSKRKAYIVTGLTSGIGRATSFEVAKHGTVILLGRDREKLDERVWRVGARRLALLSMKVPKSPSAPVPAH